MLELLSGSPMTTTEPSPKRYRQLHTPTAATVGIHEKSAGPRDAGKGYGSGTHGIRIEGRPITGPTRAVFLILARELGANHGAVTVASGVGEEPPTDRHHSGS
jgi:hypothetical protein